MIQGYPIDTIYISYSTMQNLNSCMRKFEFAKLYNYNLRTESLASSGGLALHAATGVYWKTKDKDAAILELALNYPIHLNRNLLNKWSLENAMAGLIATMQWIDNNPQYEIAIINDEPAIELGFHINIIHGIKDLPPVIYRGYIDFVLFNNQSGQFVAQDLKTTTMYKENWATEYKHSTQCVPYGMLVSSLLNQQLQDKFSVEYLVTHLDILHPVCELLSFKKTPTDVQDWTRGLYFKLQQIKACIDMQWFPRRDGSCNAYSYDCKYFSMCDNREQEKIKLLLMKFRKEKPLVITPKITLDLILN